ncbi:hypothetical protein BDW42DRAFT_178062, partial [Aspergillus taichungensis]
MDIRLAFWLYRGDCFFVHLLLVLSWLASFSIILISCGSAVRSTPYSLRFHRRTADTVDRSL